MKFRSILFVLLVFRGLLSSGITQENFIGVGAGFGERLEVETVERWLSEDLTWEAWVRLDGWNKLQPILTISAGEANFSLVSGWRSKNFEAPADWRSSQLAFFTNSEWDGGDPLWVSDAALISREWVHLAVTISNNEIKVFVDGQWIEMGFSSALISWDKFVGRRMRFGFGETRDREGSLHVFTGALDEVRLWTHARSQRELRSTMMLRLTGEEPGLLSRWDLDGPKSSSSNPKHVVTRKNSLHLESLSWDSVRRSSANLESTAPVTLTSKLNEGMTRTTGQHSWTLAAYGPDGSRVAVWQGEIGLKNGAPHCAVQEVQSIHHYEAFVNGRWLGSWYVDGTEIATGSKGAELLEVGHFESRADFGTIRSLESAPLGMNLDGGALSGFDRLSDGRITATGEQVVFWWDGSQFHSLFPEHFKVENWVEIFDSVFLLEVGAKWITYSEMSGVWVEWEPLEDVLGSNVWESDGNGTLWVALQDKTLEMTLAESSAEGFWKSLAFEGSPSASGVQLQWQSKIISPHAGIQMKWTASDSSLWALTESGLFCYSKRDEEGRFISDESGDRFLSGKFQLANSSDGLLWVASNNALLRIQNSGELIESIAWPAGFNEMFSGAGRIWIAPGSTGGVWALNEIGVLAYRRGDSWITKRLQDVSFSSTQFKLVALDPDSAWVLDQQICRRVKWEQPVVTGGLNALDSSDLNQAGVFRMGIADYQHGIRLRNLGPVLDETKPRVRGKALSMKKEITSVEEDRQIVTGSKLVFEAHVFSDSNQFEKESDSLVWLARWKASSSVDGINLSMDDPGWKMDPSDLSLSSESQFLAYVDGRVAWIPDRPGYYKITAAKRRWDGVLVESNPIFLQAVAPWYLSPVTKFLAGGLALMILAGLSSLCWMGYRAFRTRPELETRIASLEVMRRGLLEELSREQILHEDVIQRLTEKEKDLKEVRFELIGRLHEEIRPLLELSLPEHSGGAGSSAKALDPEFKVKIREALQFLSDLCLVELDHQEGELDPGRMEWFSLDELLSELERWFKKTCQNKKIQFRSEIQNLTTSVVGEDRADSKLENDQMAYGPFDKIRSILFHLVSNAIHYTSQGEVLVSLKLKPKTGAETQEEALLEVEVLDTGVGIDQEEMRRICEPGYRGKNSKSNWRPGTGAGLFLTRKALENLGSKLEVESLTGAGSRFRFKLTVFLPQPSEAQSSYEKTGTVSGKVQQGKALSEKQLQEVRNAEESSALLWMEIELQVQYGAWHEVALLILRLKKLPITDQEQLKVFSSIVLRKGREESLDWLKARNKSSE